jgi:Zn2+/Cd2+-exporting ATPase
MQTTANPPTDNHTEHARDLQLTLIAGVALVAGLVADHVVDSTALAWACYAVAYLSGGYAGVVAGVASLLRKTIDVDLLMVLAAIGAAVVGAPFEGGLLLFLFSLSNVLQNHAMGRSRKAIQALMQLRPATALCRTDRGWEERAVDTIAAGTVVRVRPGDYIALDGEVQAGSGSVDESSLTGESMPVAKEPGSPLFAGTLNQTGSLEFVVSRAAADSTLARIIAMVENAHSEKAKTQRYLERAEQHYALGVILLTLGLIIVPPLLGRDFFDSFYRAMTVMVVASPCALIISTPAAFLSAIGGAARRGVLFQGGRTPRTDGRRASGGV